MARAKARTYVSSADAFDASLQLDLTEINDVGVQLLSYAGYGGPAITAGSHITHECLIFSDIDAYPTTDAEVQELIDADADETKLVLRAPLGTNATASLEFNGYQIQLRGRCFIAFAERNTVTNALSLELQSHSLITLITNGQ